MTLVPRPSKVQHARARTVVDAALKDEEGESAKACGRRAAPDERVHLLARGVTAAMADVPQAERPQEQSSP